MGCSCSKGGVLSRGAVAPAPEEPGQPAAPQGGQSGGPTKRRGSVGVGGGAAAAGSPLPSPAGEAAPGPSCSPLPPPPPPQVSAEPSGVSRGLSQVAGRQSVVNQKPLDTRERIRAIVRSTLLFKGAPAHAHAPVRTVGAALGWCRRCALVGRGEADAQREGAGGQQPPAGQGAWETPRRLPACHTAAPGAHRHAVPCAHRLLQAWTRSSRGRSLTPWWSAGWRRGRPSSSECCLA